MVITIPCIIPLLIAIVAIVIFIIYKDNCKYGNIVYKLFISAIFISFLLFSGEVDFSDRIINKMKNLHFNKMKITSENTERTLNYSSTYSEDEDNITYVLKDGSKFKINKSKILSTKKGSENKIIIKDIQFDYICTNFFEKDAYNIIDKNKLYKQVYEIYSK